LRKQFLGREKEFSMAIKAEVIELEKVEHVTTEIKRRRCLEFHKELEHLVKERECAHILEMNKLRRILEEEQQIIQADREEARKSTIVLLKAHINNLSNFINLNSLNNEERVILIGEKRTNAKHDT
jgi:uncharacterized protein (UPF0210 family)